MENIIDKIVFKQSNAIAEAIDNYCLKIFNAPSWITKRLWLYKIYAKMRRFEIRKLMDKPNLIEFYVGGEKVGEMNIVTSN